MHVFSRRWPALRLAGTLGLSATLLVSGFPISAQKAWAASEPQTVSVVFTNDVHCAYEHAVDDTNTATTIGYDYLAGYIDTLEAAQGKNRVTVIDAGDAIQGGPVGTVTKGDAIVELMNAVGYDYAIPGNHEFDYGMDRFMELTKKSNATYLSSNFQKVPSGELVFKGYDVVDYGPIDTGKAAENDGELKIGYVGISTPESLIKSSPSNFQDENGNYIYGFAGDESGAALYDSVQESVDSAKAAGADYVVAVAHLGNEGTTPRWTSTSVIENTTGIDAMIDGHSHEAYTRTVNNENGQPVALAQTGTKMANLGLLTINPTDATPISFKLVPASAVNNPDPAVTATIDQISAELEAELGVQVGTAAVNLTVNDEAGKRRIRSGETNMGDLVADAYRAAIPGADIGLANGGGVRADIPAGPVTKEQIINVQPFGNMLCLVEMDGQTLLDGLEMAARNYPEENGGFLQVSGMSYKIDPTVQSTVETDKDGNFVKVAGARRVYDVTVGGKPIDPQATYRVASHSFMLIEGGDGMTMFKNAKVLLQEVALDNQALIDYIVDDLGGTVNAGYENIAGAGRITVAQQTTETPANPTPDPTPNTNPNDQNSNNTTAQDPAKIPATGDGAFLTALIATAGTSTAGAGAWLLKRRREAKR